MQPFFLKGLMISKGEGRIEKFGDWFSCIITSCKDGVVRYACKIGAFHVPYYVEIKYFINKHKFRSVHWKKKKFSFSNFQKF